MLNKSRIIIVGSGITGASTAYHLAKLGWKDITVLDQGPLFETGGSTSHAPGGVFQTNPSRMMCKFAQYTVDLLRSLEFEGKPCYHTVGGIEVSKTKERHEDLYRKLGLAHSYGLSDATIITPEEVQKMSPYIDPEKIYGGYYVPTDGLAAPVRAVQAMAKYVTDLGAGKFIGNTAVTGFKISNNQIQGVETENGLFEADIVLVATGIWSPKMGRLAGISLPLVPCEHQMAWLEPFEELKEFKADIKEALVEHALVRHQDHSLYFRQWNDTYVIGNYRHEPRILESEELLKPKDAIDMPSLVDWRADDFEGAHKETNWLFPSFADKKLTKKINGIFSFTTDGNPLMGETSIKGLWSASAVWITHSGGVGKAMAEWIVNGEPELDVREGDINRFHKHHHVRKYLRARGKQNYKEVYDIIHPLQQMEQPRPLRRSPFYSRLNENKAQFFETMGWERPQWYETNLSLIKGKNFPNRTGWSSKFWSPIQAAEHLVTRQTGALFDITGFVKIEVSGKGALDLLQKVCTNNINIPVGKVVYSVISNIYGGIKSDLTISRLEENKFWVLAGAGNGMIDLSWLRDNAPDDGSVNIIDWTSAYAGIGLWGPNSRKVLESLCEDDDVSNDQFPFFSIKNISISHVPCIAVRISYIGELGWEIYTPTEYGLTLWDELRSKSLEYNMICSGAGAFESLRLEKGYRSLGSDIHTNTNPYEAGLGFTVKLKKENNFIGKDALMKLKESPLEKKLCCMVMSDSEGMALGKEPIYDNHGKSVGYVSSANYGYFVDKHIIYGYLPYHYAEEGTKLELDYFGKRYPIMVTKEPLLDPENKRLKS
ncbi:FAD-dependent oxidoreductase [Alphaproteobacteria bacterium]|nr:FAD-dependent oxidoreductase [Alphaproteobacteria bacterium]